MKIGGCRVVNMRDMAALHGLDLNSLGFPDCLTKSEVLTSWAIWNYRIERLP